MFATRLAIIYTSTGGQMESLVQLFKINDVVSLRIVKTSIIKYGIVANIFAEKIWVAKATYIFQQKHLWNRYCTY